MIVISAKKNLASKLSKAAPFSRIKKTLNGKSNKENWGFGGIVDDNGNFIKSSHVNSAAGAGYVPEEPVRQSSDTVIYLGMFHSTWGHVITDNIRRMWFLNSDDFKNYFKNCPLIYLVCTKKKKFDLKSYPNFRRLLELLEVDVDRFQLIEQPTRFKKVILPDESFFIDKARRFSSEYCECIDRVRYFAMKNYASTSSKKIYYFHGARQIGEERIAEYFKSKGYMIVLPEKLTLDEQLNILINCNSFASTLGSCAHNSVFLRNGTETIFIPRAPFYFLTYQNALNQVNMINANYVDSTLSIFGSGHDFNCYIVSKQLQRFFGEKVNLYEADDFKIFLQYVKNAVAKGLAINLKQKSIMR